MKTLYMIGGTMGIGKTAVSQALKKLLPGCVFLDGDWCWDADPFQVTDETKGMVLRNICYMLNSFLQCSAYENIVFCWVMHEQSIIDDILGRIDTTCCTVRCISLTADAETVRQRLEADIQRGIRSQDITDRSLARLPMYDALDTIRIDTSGKSIAMIAEEIANL